jgi:hypothetical protein
MVTRPGTTIKIIEGVIEIHTLLKKDSVGTALKLRPDKLERLVQSNSFSLELEMFQNDVLLLLLLYSRILN